MKPMKYLFPIPFFFGELLYLTPALILYYESTSNSDLLGYVISVLFCTTMISLHCDLLNATVKRSLLWITLLVLSLALWVFDRVINSEALAVGLCMVLVLTMAILAFVSILTSIVTTISKETYRET